MATETTNLKLKKPENNDYVNIEVLNENFDVIDEKMGELQNREVVSPEDFESHKEDKLLHLPSGGTKGQVPVKTESGVEWGEAGDPEVLDEHITNKEIHVTEQEKETWNGKSEGNHTHTLADLPITYGTIDLTAGTSSLTSGEVYLVYE